MSATRPVLRARKEEQKDERRRALLDSARSLIEEQAYAAVKVADVASRAGFAKGTVFVYYPTKEALFLALTEELLEAWMVVVASELEDGRGRFTAARAAKLLATSLAEQPTLTRMLSILASVLEQNADVALIAQFKTKLLAGLTLLGGLLEKRLPFLEPGGGAHLLVRAYALVVGLHALAEPGKSALEAIESRPELAPLKFDFKTELESALAVMLRGLER